MAVNVRLSNTFIAIINLLTFLLSIPILSTGIYLSSHAITQCQHFLQIPLIVVGSLLMAASLAGLAGVLCRVPWLLWLYLLAAFLLILAALAFTVFVFVVTHKGAGEAVSGRGYKEYRLGDYSDWLQKKIGDERSWAKIKSCLKDAGVCKSLQESKTSVDDFFNNYLSPTESGCCKPPTGCGFVYKSPTVWDKPAGFPTAVPDCGAWANDPSALCYDCQSCKAGVIENVKSDWRKVAIINIVFLFLLILVYCIGCHALRNIRSDAAAFGGWIYR